MPRGDRTGPAGAGPMTGRGAGYCNDYAAPGFADNRAYGVGAGRGFGRGFGRGPGQGFRQGFGRGFGRGFCRMEYVEANRPAVDEKTYLDNEAQYLEAQLQEVKKRLSQMNETE